MRACGKDLHDVHRRCAAAGAARRAGNTRIVSSECVLVAAQGMALAHEEEQAVLGHRLDRQSRGMPFGAGRVGDGELELAGQHLAREMLEIRMSRHARAAGNSPRPCDPSAAPSGNSAANMSVPKCSSGACRPASSSRSRVRSRACEKMRLAWSITSRPASPGLNALRRRVDEVRAERGLERQDAFLERFGTDAQRVCGARQLGRWHELDQVQQAGCLHHGCRKLAEAVVPAQREMSRPPRGVCAVNAAQATRYDVRGQPKWRSKRWISNTRTR